MKILSRMIKIAGSVGLTVALVAVATVPTYAVDGAIECTQVATFATKSGATLTAKLATMDSDFTTRLTTIATRDTTVDTNVAAARTKATAAFDAKVLTMNTAANVTTAQKAAIKTYSDGMHAAETTREKAVDAARQDYRADLTATVKLHQTNLTNAATTYQSAVATAFTNAAVNCKKADGTGLSTLRTDITTAKAAFKTSRDDAKVVASIKTLATTRNTAIKTADADFTKTAEALTTALTAVMNAPSSTANS